MKVSTLSRRVAAVVVGAVVVAMMPLASASAAGDTIAFVGITAGEYLPSGTTRSISADASTNDIALSVDLYVNGVQRETKLCDPAGSGTCLVTFAYDTSLLADGTYTTSVRLNTVVGPDVMSDVVRDGFTFFVGDAPVASITAPASGSKVSSSVDITVRGVTDPQGTDYPVSFTLRNGGTTIGTAGPCDPIVLGDPPPTDCSQVITWNLTGVSSGMKSLTVVVTTHDGSTDTSATRSITVGALPTVSITSPTTGSKVLPSASDVVTVSATGTSDAAFGSQQKLFELFVDDAVTPADTATCTSQLPCGRSLTWDTSALSGGSHSLRVDVTALGRTATDTVTVTLADAPVVTVVPPPGGTVKGATTITVTAQTDAATSEDPKSVVLSASNGVDPAIVFASANCTSAPVAGACSFTVPWDTSKLSGSYTLTAVLTTTALRTRTSAGVVAATDNPGPTVTVTAPTATVVKGRFTISAAAKVEAPLTGHITSIALFVGSTRLGATKTCAVASTCTIWAVWDTTLLANGPVNILARVTTSNTGTREFDSNFKAVTLRNPSPSISWISPTNGAVVTGSAVTIKVGLGTDATQSDVPKSAAIYRNGSSTPFDTYLCKATSHACIATFTWNASRAAGLSTFVVKVRTTKERVRFSSSTAPRKLYASTRARITFLPSTSVDNGGRVTVTGRMVAVRTGLGVPNAVVTLVRDPAIGSTTTSTIRTNSTGRFTFTYTARSNTTVTARSISLKTASGKIWMPPATGLARQQVRAPMTCRANNRTVSSGQKGSGSCSVPGLPFGTPLTLRYFFNGKWTTLASGTSTTQRIPFVYVFPAKGSYQLRVILSGTKVYAGTNSDLMPVTVR